MPQQSPSATSGSVRRIQSDALPQLTATLQQLVPIFGAEMFQVNVIIDANVAIGEVRWLVRKRTNPDSRTRIQELLACGVVTAFAPTYLLTEMRRKIPVIAKREGLDRAAMQAEWERYQTRIKFIDVGRPRRGKGVLDAKDTPYLRLQNQIEAVIISDDHHIAAMGGKVVRVDLFPPLQRYSRNAAIEYNLKVQGVGAVLLAGIGIKAGVEAARAVARLPKPVLFGGAVLLTVALMHPGSSRKIFQGVGALAEIMSRVGSGVLDAALPHIIEHDRARNEALENRELATQMLGHGAQ